MCKNTLACFDSGREGSRAEHHWFLKRHFLGNNNRNDTNVTSEKRKINSENQKGRKGFLVLLSLKQLYVSKREIREVETELLMSNWADKKEGSFLGAIGILISLAGSKSAADRVNIKVT